MGLISKIFGKKEHLYLTKKREDLIETNYRVVGCTDDIGLAIINSPYREEFKEKIEELKEYNSSLESGKYKRWSLETCLDIMTEGLQLYEDIRSLQKKLLQYKNELKIKHQDVIRDLERFDYT